VAEWDPITTLSSAASSAVAPFHSLCRISCESVLSRSVPPLALSASRPVREMQLRPHRQRVGHLPGVRNTHVTRNRSRRLELVSAAVAFISFGALFATLWYAYGYIGHGFVVGFIQGRIGVGLQRGRNVGWAADRVEYRDRRLRGLPEIYSDPSSTVIVVPLWIPGVVGLGYFWFLLRRRRRICPGHCPTCEYDLTGNMSGICPECGTAIPTDSSTPEVHAAGPSPTSEPSA
jgi:hypothetical protein